MLHSLFVEILKLIYAGIQKNKPENIEKRRIAQNKREQQEREDREKYGD